MRVRRGTWGNAREDDRARGGSGVGVEVVAVVKLARVVGIGLSRSVSERLWGGLGENAHDADGPGGVLGLEVDSIVPCETARQIGERGEERRVQLEVGAISN